MGKTRIRDPGWKKFGYGIREKHPGCVLIVPMLTWERGPSRGYGGWWRLTRPSASSHWPAHRSRGRACSQSQSRPRPPANPLQRKNQCVPDPDWIRNKMGQLIRIQAGQNCLAKNRGKWRNFMFEKFSLGPEASGAWMSFIPVLCRGFKKTNRYGFWSKIFLCHEDHVLYPDLYWIQISTTDWIQIRIHQKD